MIIFFISEHTEAPVKPNEKSGQDKIASTKKETKINTGGTKKRRRKTGATSGTIGKVTTNLLWIMYPPWWLCYPNENLTKSYDIFWGEKLGSKSA